jgi:hypothetical protein
VPAIADPRLLSDLIILVIKHAELNELLVHVFSLLKQIWLIKKLINLIDLKIFTPGQFPLQDIHIPGNQPSDNPTTGKPPLPYSWTTLSQKTPISGRKSAFGVGFIVTF